jgi:ribose transport system ATP-binding protein
MWTLSGGNQQKVILARWLRCRPRVLLLDEPTRGVDANARSDITVAVREVSASGAVVIVVSSDLDDLCAVADRVIVLVNGRVACEKVRPPLEPRQIAQLAYASGPTE